MIERLRRVRDPIDAGFARQPQRGGTMGHQGKQPIDPAKNVAIVACMDARIDVEDLLGLQTGDAHIIRNAGVW
jgi:carbonic anhydrase